MKSLMVYPSQIGRSESNSSRDLDRDLKETDHDTLCAYQARFRLASTKREPRCLIRFILLPRLDQGWSNGYDPKGILALLALIISVVGIAGLSPGEFVPKVDFFSKNHDTVRYRPLFNPSSAIPLDHDPWMSQIFLHQFFASFPLGSNFEWYVPLDEM